MDAERWQRVGELFHRALEQGADERSRFLDGACGGDPALRAEIESLLAHHENSAPPAVPTPAGEATLTREGTAERDSLAGRQLGPYRITRKLGEGGMGVVHLAEDTRLGRLVAIKALPARFTRDERRQRRLRREARAAASLAHPGIATVYALEEFDDTLCIVSEYVPGATLRQELGGGALPPAALLDTAIEIARALAAAHEGNVLHRDLKPDNVIRTADDGIKLVDFGLARFDDPEGGALASATQLTAPGAMLGTPGYMAPEQIRGEGVDARTDIFAFGVLLFELATARHPFSASGPVSMVARVLEAPPPDLRASAPACPPALQDIVHRCMQKEPARRYASTRELVGDLERARGGPTASAARPATEDAAQSVDAPARGERYSPVWWWQFHQRAAGCVYYAMLYPLWRVREWAPAPWGSAVFFLALAAVLVAANLRFHLSFTARFTPVQLDFQQTQVAPWIRAADWVFVVLLLAATALLAEARPAWASLTAGVGVVSALTFLVIEPATTRAAFRHRPTAPS